MGLLQQNQRQHYSSKKSFTGDGTTFQFVVSDKETTFNAFHTRLHDTDTAFFGTNGSYPEDVNPYVKVYIDNVLYAEKVVNDTSTIGNLTYDKRHVFRYDATAGWILEFYANYIPSSDEVINIEIDQSIWLDPGSNVTQSTTNSYQVTSLEDIISNFMIAYTGEDKIINKASRTDVQFHAMRALQELSFDTFKSCKSMELKVPASLVLPLPNDYVNYVKVSWKDSSGTKRPLYLTKDTSNPMPITQDADGNVEFDVNSDSSFDDTSNAMSNKNSNTWIDFKSGESSDITGDYQDDIYWPTTGRRYGLDPSHTNVNGVYFIDCIRNMINFSSNLNGSVIVLDYISDSLGTDNEMVVHKMAEEAMYKWIMYGMLSTRSNIQEQIVQRYKKEKFAETRKAKLRLSNIKLEEITQILRGKSKFIKH